MNANRSIIDKNDLPQSIINIQEDKNLNKIEKTKILNSDDFSFVYSKYIKEHKNNNFKFKRIKISEIAEIFSGSRQKGGSLEKGIPSIGGAQIDKNGKILDEKMVFISEEHFSSMKKGQLKMGDVLIVKDGATTGKMGFYNGEYTKAAINEHIFVLRTKENFNNYFLYYLLKNNNFQIKLKPFIQGIIGGINLKFSNIELPFPNIETQKQIVEELDNYQKIIDGCRQVVKHYKPSINIDPNWELVELNEVAEVISGQSPPSSSYNINKNGLPFYQGKTDYGDIYLKDTDNYTSEVTKISKKNDIIMSVRAPVGPVNLNPFEEICIGRGLCAIRPKNIEDLEFIFNYLQVNGVVKGHMGSTYESINRDEILKIKIPNPDKKDKDKIINQILEERKIIEGNKKIIVKFSEKISNTINKIWLN